MEILANLGWVILGLTMLYFGAEWLVQGSSELAIKFGVSPLVVGLTVVAFGTSAPELLVCLQANFQGKGDLAIGNIVGSNICNIAMVLGVSAIIYPLTIHVQIIKRDMAVLTGVSLLFIAMLLFDNQLSRIEGIVLLAGVIAYTIYSIVEARRLPSGEYEDAVEPEVVEEVLESGEERGMVNLGLIVIGIVFLFIGSDRLVLGAEAIAKELAVPEAIIALTLIAFGTSLPELATGVMASWRKQGDIVVGNAVGSCVFNLLAVGGFTAAVAPVVTVSLNWIDLAVMLATTVVGWLMMRSGRSLSRIEGGLMLAAYLGYCFYLTTR